MYSVATLRRSDRPTLLRLLKDRRGLAMKSSEPLRSHTDRLGSNGLFPTAAPPVKTEAHRCSASLHSNGVPVSRRYVPTRLGSRPQERTFPFVDGWR